MTQINKTILLCTIGSAGDVNPFIGIGRRLKERGFRVVHHGGIGTTAQAIATGIPHVIRPMAHDQPDTALRVEKLGIGAALDPKNFNAATLAQKLETLISSRSVRKQCKSLASKIHPEQALEDTCALIEDMAGNKKEGKLHGYKTISIRHQ